jgi:hypothetical protein
MAGFLDVVVERDQKGIKKPPGLPAVVWMCFAGWTYAFASPAAERCENQKYVK